MFSAQGTYQPIGLFSNGHIISIIICFFLVALAVFFTRKMSSGTLDKMLMVCACLFTVLEIFKIIWNLTNGYNHVNQWVPLYFCSLFIYALWFSIFKNKFMKEMGLSYIALAGIFSGAVFIILPTTSFNDYPIFHFQCIYSMLFHSVMLYVGIMTFITKAVKINLKLVAKYCIYCAIFMSLAIIVNIAFNGNLMFLTHPGVIPLPFLKAIHNYSPVIYTLTIVIAHMLLGFTVYGINKGIELVKQPDEETEFKDV